MKITGGSIDFVYFQPSSAHAVHMIQLRRCSADCKSCSNWAAQTIAQPAQSPRGRLCEEPARNRVLLGLLCRQLDPTTWGCFALQSAARRNSTLAHCASLWRLLTGCCDGHSLVSLLPLDCGRLSRPHACVTRSGVRLQHTSGITRPTQAAWRVSSLCGVVHAGLRQCGCRAAAAATTRAVALCQALLPAIERRL